MTEVNSERLILDVIAAALPDLRAGTRWPDDDPDTFALVTLLSSPVKWSGFWTQMTVMLQVSAPSRADAYATLSQIRAALHDAKKNQTVFTSGWITSLNEVSGLYPVPEDTATQDGRARYALSFLASARL